MKRFWILAAVALSGAMLAGCASTPESRIEKNRPFFDSLPLERPARIRGGATDGGFSAEETRLALGEPSRVYVRKDAAGEAAIWEYRDEVRRYERQRVDWVDGRPGGKGTMSGYVNVLQSLDEVRTRVELRGGVVTAVESLSGGR
ncbi:MAG: hypothetical protein J6Y19_12070 [Kiritimatiellae bacterium]|nr:hypothetical protein [Kiritimatiellia bacterium]